ncbi:MAG: acyl-CoA dehydrogenase family protein [Acidimicrobiia bacterium]
MELSFSKDDEQFRDEARTWLAEHAPQEARPHSNLARREWDLAWQRVQWDGGWAGVGWPAEYGGLGLPLVRQLIWLEEYARLGLDTITTTFVGERHAGPTLIARATDAQKAFHLPKILRGDVVWCQGFSEPEAGSDLASLRTFAEVDGDQLVVTGQKIWTSFADAADYQELLVRTNRDVPKHKGLTWVICDMHTPGIDVRPIRTIDGGADFSEVFYDEARIPLANVVGEIDDGWRVAMATLSFERGTAFTLDQVQLAMLVEELIGMARERTGPNGRPLIDDEELARALAAARADVASLRAMTYLGVSRNLDRAEPGPEGSMLKLYWSDLSKRVARLALDVIGANTLTRSDPVDGRWLRNFLTSFSHSIGGGTSEIQRNIIGERVLGLPR